MKRVKIMLTGVTILAVVGGALAFKASSFTQFHVYTGSAVGASCNVDQGKFKPATGTNTISFANATTRLNDPCLAAITVSPE